MPEPQKVYLDENGEPITGKVYLTATGETTAAPSTPSMNFATVNGQRVPVDDGPLDLVAGAWNNTVGGIPAVIQTVGQAAMSGAKVFGGVGTGDLKAVREGTSELGQIGGDILAAQNHVKQGADEAWAKGDYPTALRKYADWLLPIIGPMMDASADKMGGDQPWRGAGEAIGAGISLFGPKAIETARIKVPVPAVMGARNPVEAAAVQFGEQRGVPIDAATASGNTFVKNIQKATGSTPLGARPAMRTQAAQSAAMEGVGQDLAQQARGAASTPDTAGAGLNEALTNKIEAHAQYAEHAYGTLDKIAADPKNIVDVVVGEKKVPTGEMDAQGYPTYKKVPIIEKMAIPVDLRGVKATLKPIYDSIARSMPVTQRQASAGFQALENIVHGNDFAPLLQTERDLGALKEIARGADLPQLRTVSQGLGAQGVTRLQAAVDAAVAKAGPKAVQALNDGRAATAAKFDTAKVWDKVRSEPVGAFRQSTAAGDAGLELLQSIQKQTPTAISQIARAWIDQALSKATSEGSLQRAQRLQNHWLELGPETKKILFPQKGQVAALDNYFRLARILAENPNPSGTALTGTSMASVQGLFYAPGATVAGNVAAGTISKLLNSPKAVRLFTKGTTLMLGPGKASKAAMSLGLADVLQAAREAGVSSRTVPVGQDETDAARRAPRPSR